MQPPASNGVNPLRPTPTPSRFARETSRLVGAGRPPRLMLENLANRFQTFVLVGLVTLLSLVFVLQFGGPQAEGCTAGGASYAARVDGETISGGDFNAAYVLAGFNRRTPEQQRSQRLWAAVLEGLVERSLLAEEARRLGYHVTDQDVTDRFMSEGSIRLSLGVDSPIQGGEVPVQVRDEEGRADAEAARRLIRNYLGRSVGEFTLSQIEEELAERMRQTIRATVEISDAEVWEAYVRERDNARIKYVRFEPAYYRESLEPTDAELRTWMSDNADAVDAEYEQNRHLYTGLDPQVRTRHLVIQATRDQDETARAEARARADVALARIRGGEDFGEVAREVSEDESARRGGDLGYLPRGRRAASYDDVAFAMEVGDVSDVVESPVGFHVIEVLGKREGDVPVEEAKLELTERLYREARAGELAEEAAREGLAALEAHGIDQLDAWLGARARGEAYVAPTPVVEGEEATEDTELPEGADESDPANPLAPRVAESSSFGRTGTPVQGPFDNTPLVRDVFMRTMEDPRPSEPIQLGNIYVIYELTERQEATREDFEGEVEERLRGGLLQAKQRETLDLYVRQLRDRAQTEGRVRIRSNDLEVEVEGNGRVSSLPSGIDCGTDCTAAFEFGNMVQLRAEPAPGATFVGWSEGCSGSETTCVVTATTAQSVTARFNGGSAPRATSTSTESDEDEADEAPEADDEPAAEE